MIKISICDDNNSFLGFLKEYVYSISRTLKYHVEVYTYNKGADVVKLICDKKEDFDILLLDIDIPDINGLKVAKLIRDLNSKLLLIFVSSYEQYVFESIEYTPFRFIRKSCIKKELPIALESAYKIVDSMHNQSTVIKTEDGEKYISRSDIVYAETEDRKVKLHMCNGKEYITRRFLKDFIDDLSDDSFLHINSGCIVNVKYINNISSYDITLDDGKRLIVSRARIKDVKTQLLNYWRGKI